MCVRVGGRSSLKAFKKTGLELPLENELGETKMMWTNEMVMKPFEKFALFSQIKRSVVFTFHFPDHFTAKKKQFNI